MTRSAAGNWSAWPAQLVIGLALLLGVRAGAQAPAADALAPVRAEFRAAYAAAQIGRSDPQSDSPELRAYVLHPYLRAARLRYALSQATGPPATLDEETEAFLEAEAGGPVTGPVRRAWLESLARRGDWGAFLAHYDSSIATEALDCQELNARIEIGETTELEPRIVERWLTPRRLAPECERSFQWLRDRGGLDELLVAERVQRLLASGQAAFARIIARRLPAEQAGPFEQWADLIEQPAATIDALLAAPEVDIDIAALLDGFARLARNSPREALKRFEALNTSRFETAALKSQAARALALGLAWDRDPEALTYFARVAAQDLDDNALEWLARAALWRGDWPMARNGMALMSSGKQGEAAWRYWSGRAAEAAGEETSARERFVSLEKDDNYYSAMAAARLGERVAPHVERLPADEGAIARIADQTPFVRVLELLRSDLRSEATLEWQFGYASLEVPLQSQAIHLAARWGLYDIAVATATSQSVFNDYALLYPRPFREEVGAATKLTRLDEPLLYGVLRQESLFRPDATSHAGALGLAQLGYSTAEITANRWQLPIPSRAELYDPETNIRLGAARLTNLIERYAGELPVALAAYNAGERAAERWLPEQPIDSDVWIENIPYNETRAYVRRVLWHSLVFDWLEDGRPKSTESWLDSVSPLQSAP